MLDKAFLFSDSLMSFHSYFFVFSFVGFVLFFFCYLMFFFSNLIFHQNSKTSTSISGGSLFLLRWG